MKTITIYFDSRSGDIVVEHAQNVDKMEIFHALASATQIVYQGVMDEEARKRAMETSQVEKLIRLMAKQRNPKMN